MIRVGRVIETKDSFAAGFIQVMPLDGDGDQPILCAPCGPGLGVEKGFLSVPCDGQVVLFAQLQDAYLEVEAGAQNHQFDFVWIGSVGEQMSDEQNRTPFGNSKHYPENYDTAHAKVRTPVRLAAGIPDPERVYAGNLIPEVDIWKHKNGHAISMSHKIAPDGTNDDSILLEARSGKIIQIDDHIGVKQNNNGSPPPGDRITLKDEKGNRIELMTGLDKLEVETNRDQEYISNEGHQSMTLMHASKGHQRRDNMGEGDIYDTVHRGQYKLTARKDISDISKKGDILYQAEKGSITVTADDNEVLVNAKTRITLQCGGSTIVMTPDSVTITAGTVNINGTTNVTGTTSITGTTSVVGLTSIAGATSIAGGLGVTGGPSVFDGITFGTHTHGGVDTGSSSTLPPNP